MTNLRMKILQALLGNLDYTLVLHDNTEYGHKGAVLLNGDGDGILQMGAILSSTMESKEEVKAVILSAAASYLSRYEIDATTFKRVVYENN